MKICTQRNQSLCSDRVKLWQRLPDKEKTVCAGPPERQRFLCDRHNRICPPPLIGIELTTGYLIAKWTKEFGSAEGIDFYFCWYFGSYLYMRQGYLCLVHRFLFNWCSPQSVVQFAISEFELVYILGALSSNRNLQTSKWIQTSLN